METCFFVFSKLCRKFLSTSISKYNFFQNSENFVEIKYSRQRVAIKGFSNDYLFSHILTNIQMNISYFCRSCFFVFFLSNRQFCYLDCTGIGALGRKKERDTTFIVMLQLSSQFQYSHFSLFRILIKFLIFMISRLEYGVLRTLSNIFDEDIVSNIQPLTIFAKKFHHRCLTGFQTRL